MTDFRILSFAVIVLLLTASACTTERPVVSTDSVSVAYPRAYVQSTVSADVVEDVLASGICFGTAPAPDLTTGTCTTADRGTGTFSDTISGLQNGSLYYVRAYATTTEGTIYGNALTFTPTMSVPGNGVTMDGHDYPTIVLGNGQEWMAENLRTGTYANGETIANVSDNLEWIGLQSGAWAHYANDVQYETPYGRLYNFYAVTDPRGLCPEGWHVPTDQDWNALIGYLDPFFIAVPPPPAENGNGGQSFIAGGLLKSMGTTHWQIPNTGASDTIGYSAFPSGKRNYQEGGYFGELGSGCYWWSSSLSDVPTARVRYLSYDYASMARLSLPYGVGISVRCIKDQ